MTCGRGVVERYARLKMCHQVPFPSSGFENIVVEPPLALPAWRPLASSGLWRQSPASLEATAHRVV